MAPRCWHQASTTTQGTHPPEGITNGIRVLLEFSLVIIPFVFLVIRPEGTRAQTKRAEDWLMSHARELIGVVILFVGAYTVRNGLVRLIG